MTDVRLREALVLPSDQDSSGRTLGDEELELLRDAIVSGTLTSTKGSHVSALETRFAEMLGVRVGLACASGTAAVHVAVAAIDPEPGDEIVTTAITDMGALAPLLYQGVVPMFADVDPVTMNLTPESVEAAISGRTRAIIATHLFGMPCDMPGIEAVAACHGLPVIEDCAQAFLARSGGRLVGSIGLVGCFSLQQGKHITTGEGGLVVSDDLELAHHMRRYVNKAWDYWSSPTDHDFLALNYRLTELQGAVGRAQLEKLHGGVAVRISNAVRLNALLAEVRGLTVPEPEPGDVHSYWRYALIVDPAIVPGGPGALAAELKMGGIASAPRYIQKPAFRCGVFANQKTFGSSRWPFTLARPEAVDYSAERFPGTFAALEHVLVLPWNERYTHDDVEALGERIADAVGRLSGERGMSAPLRFGLVGAGGIAQAYVQVLADLDEAVVVGVADPRSDAAEMAAAALGCRSFPDVETLANGAALDGVLLCTPPATHVRVAEYFVRLGVPVLCEKPFAVTPGEARGLIAEADAASVIVTMAAKFRYVDDVRRARDILDSGVLGEPILFENVFASRVAMSGRWNAEPHISGGGVLIDNGTHSVDIARFFLGRISEVHAVEGRRVQGLEVEDTAQMFLRTEQEVLGTVDLSWSIDKSVDYFVRICCSEGTIEVGWHASRYRQAGAKEWTVFGPGYDKVAAMRAEILNFARALRGSEELLITADDAIASVDVIAAAYRSITRRQWVAVASPHVRVVGDTTAAADVA